jgi:hypothetical protein
VSAITERRRYLRRRDDKAAYLGYAEIPIPGELHELTPLPAELITRGGSSAGIAILAVALFVGVVLGLIVGRFF